MGVFCTHRSQNYSLLRKIWKINSVISRSALDLAYKVYGPSPTSGTPILVLHGLLGSKRNWNNVCNQLTASMNTSVIAVDARNHGDSPHDSSHTYLELASDVSKLITSLSLNSAVLIGHSMGGRTGMALALTEPSKVEKLVVVDITPVARELRRDYFPKLMTVMKSVSFEGLDTVQKARDAVKTKITESGLIKGTDQMFYIFMNIGQEKDGSFKWRCNVDALINNFDEVASFPDLSGKTYEGPTLFVGGQESDHIPPDDITAIQKLFPKAQLQYVSGAGHNVHAEKPKEFLNLVIPFLLEK
ncbi:unnamed protein product [Chrysodeixis includens]|uniref:sn-1-specific diacylglycerol lipase ABHD11 n=1 Tax=Chrysodeixis includens TaxID=689277 RepID=A0A9P0BNH6_CHRIL|nr:unnamed protein product [Chrysodeixis includens]